MHSACRSVSFAVLFLIFPLAALVVARAATAKDTWLRVDDPVAAQAIASGREKSATFRALLERLGRSDLIIYVDRTPTLSDRSRADTRFVVRAGGFRFLRVRLAVTAVTNATVALVGHELRHAAEVADAPWIVDEASYGAHFKAVGFASCLRPQPCYETDDAVVAGNRILHELTAERPPVAPRSEGQQVSVGE
jgi:hypothetical protein